jgi:hypothetical protein
VKLSIVELKWTDVDGGGRVERFLDIVVDGVSLHKLVSHGRPGSITPMGAIPVEEEIDKYVSRLLGDLPPDSWAEQCCIFICPGCGDIDCGAITVKVEKHDNVIVWSDFAFEYPDFVDDTHAYEPVDPIASFCFDASHLRAVLLGRPRQST